MKKLIKVLLSLILCFSFVACAPAENDNNPAQGEDGGGSNVNPPIELTLEETITVNQGKIKMYAQEVFADYAEDNSAYAQDSERMQVLSKWLNAIAERTSAQIGEAKTKQEVEALYRSGKEEISLFAPRYYENVTIDVPYLDFVYTSDQEGLEYSIIFRKGSPFASGGTGVFVDIGTAGLTFKVVSNMYSVHGATSLNGDEIERGEGYVVITKEEQRAYFIRNDVGGGDYAGVIVYKDQKIVGYASVYDQEYRNAKSVNFDLARGQEVTEEQVIELMKLAYKGIDGEAELKELPNKKSLPLSNSQYYQGAVPENWRYIEDNPSVLFEVVFCDEEQAETEYEVWSDIAFTYNGEEVKSAKVKGGERVYFTDRSGENAEIKAKTFVGGEFVGVAVIKIRAEKEGQGKIKYEVASINASIKMGGYDSYGYYEHMPDELINAYIDYFAGQDVPEIRV